MRRLALLLFATTLLDCVPALAQAACSSTDTLTLTSRVLGRPRQAFVALPCSWPRTSRSYPVLVVLDAEAYFNVAATIQEQLANLGHVPEAIVVGIPNASNDYRDRVHDMTPPGMAVSGSSLNEGGDDFLDFIEKELLPEIDRQFRGGRPRMLVGHSSGGVIATWAAATRPELFPVVVAIDAPIGLDGGFLGHHLLERARDGGAAPLRYVSLESQFGWSTEQWSELQALAPASWMLERERLDGESHQSMFFLATYQGLKKAFADYSVVHAPSFPDGTSLDVFEHFHRVEEALGATLPPPERVLRRLFDDLLTEGHLTLARQTLSWLVEGYGPPHDQGTLEQLLARVEPLLPLEETVAELRSTPFPTPEEAASWVGEWVGEAWVRPERKQSLTLRIRIAEGGVEAETTFPFGPEMRTRPVDYLAVLPEGLEFGNMNGMRPAGMLIYSGHRDGEVLQGELTIRGVLFPLPGGPVPPTTHFRLVRSPPD